VNLTRRAVLRGVSLLMELCTYICRSDLILVCIGESQHPTFSARSKTVYFVKKAHLAKDFYMKTFIEIIIRPDILRCLFETLGTS